MISIVIPTYEQGGKGYEYLTILFESIKSQLQTKYEVVVSDNSKDSSIMQVCERYKAKFPLVYVHNPISGVSNNFNSAIKHATSDKIKLMCMDDKFNSPFALSLFARALDRFGWAVCNSTWINDNDKVTRQHFAHWNNNLIKGINSIGMPSVIAYKRCELLFDENLTTLSDCFFYWQLMQKYGHPQWIAPALVAQRFHDLSLSNNIPHNGEQEYQYIKTKYNTHA